MTSLSNDFHTALQLIASMDTELSEIIFLSLYVSGISTLFASIIALPFGIYLAIVKFPMRGGVITLLNAMTGLPPVVLGLVVYLLLSRAGPLGEWGILYTPNAMIFTQTLLVFPIIGATVRMIADAEYTKLRPYYTMLKIPTYRIILSMLYEVRFIIFSAVMLGLGRALSEVGAMLIVGGNIDGYTRIMTTAISLETGKGNLGFALALGTVLIGIIICINGLSFYGNTVVRKYYGT